MPKSSLRHSFLVGASAFAVVLVAFPAPIQAATSKCLGERATIVGTQRDDSLNGTTRRDVIVGLGAADTINGRGGGDLICSGGGADVVIGGGGADRVDAGPGSDIVFGQAGNDALMGGSGVDALLGGKGSDRHIGGSDLDLAAFLDAPSGVVVDLGQKIATGFGQDSLTEVEGIIGSHHSDIMRGNGSLNVFFGGEGDDQLVGRQGTDFAFFTLSTAGVSVDLASAQAEGEGSDTLNSIENAVGSNHGDSLKGTGSANYLSGEGGNDLIDGRGGGDICYAESVSNCIESLPSTSEPPEGTDAAVGAKLASRAGDKFPPPERAPGPPSESQASERHSAVFPGSLSCPMLTGTAVMTYPSYTGYGYWAWRRSYPWPVGPWNYGPWMYFNGARWIAHYGVWFDVTNTAAWAGGHSTAIEAWYYHVNSARWYKVGECFTQTPHLIPGLTMVPSG